MHASRSIPLITLFMGAILLAGCAEPISISVATTIASYSFDGLSYASQGKSVSDIALSQMADEDCALLRIFEGGPICHDYTLEQRRDMALALVEADQYDRRASGTSDPDLYAPRRAPNPIFVAQAREAQAKLDEARAAAPSSGEKASLKADRDDFVGTASPPEPSAQTQARVREHQNEQEPIAMMPAPGANRAANSLLADRLNSGGWRNNDRVAAPGPDDQSLDVSEEQASLPH